MGTKHVELCKPWLLLQKFLSKVKRFSIATPISFASAINKFLIMSLGCVSKVVTVRAIEWWGGVGWAEQSNPPASTKA